ncbi:MAG: Ribosomal small subunit methyltransferase [Acidobacteria bacterium]|nr:Ribosomal small subunit methyltransferase [Acidobacteriota bacterium]
MSTTQKKQNQKTAKISPARLAAFEILSKIETEKAFSSVLLPFYEEKLSPEDRALCHEITLGVLRKQLYLDRIIGNYTNNKKLDAAVTIALRIGLYQLLFLDKIPAYSAINESVNIVQKAKKTSAKGFVNAVLRRATREKFEFEFADEIERISVETSHPRWLLEKWSAQFGAQEAEKLAIENNRIPQLAFRLTGKFFRRNADEQSEILSEIDAAYEKSEHVESCYITEKYDAKLFALADSGDIYFQDEGSQMVGQAVNLQKGERFLDVCASPGSKTTQIDAQSFNKKTRNSIFAGDLHFQRVKFLRENCRSHRAGSVKIVQYDAEKSLPFAEESFDAVLLDAPCSGTGTIRHNPEIRYFLEEKDFADLKAKQLRILNNASNLLKTGGRLIYSTCSLEVEENEAVCKTFLNENRNFIQTAAGLPEKFLTSENFARTFPQKDKMDGFFIAVFEKK